MSTLDLTTPTITLRPAHRDEARLVGAFFQIASDGMANHTWARLAEPDESLLDVAERRFQRENVDFSYHNARFAVIDGRIAGMVHAYPMLDPIPSPGELAAMDPVLRPLAELDIPGSYYIAALAVDPARRGRGIGATLLQAAEARGRAQGYRLASLVVFSSNTGAHRLYQRLGYREADRRALIQSEHFRLHGEALMLVKTL